MFKKIFKVIVILSFIPYIVVIYSIIHNLFTGVAYRELVSTSFGLENELLGIANYLKYCFNNSYFGTFTGYLVAFCLILQIIYLCMKFVKK